jgi:hypothetical protein
LPGSSNPSANRFAIAESENIATASFVPNYYDRNNNKPVLLLITPLEPAGIWGKKEVSRTKLLNTLPSWYGYCGAIWALRTQPRGATNEILRWQKVANVFDTAARATCYV